MQGRGKRNRAMSAWRLAQCRLFRTPPKGERQGQNRGFQKQTSPRPVSRGGICFIPACGSSNQSTQSQVCFDHPLLDWLFIVSSESTPACEPPSAAPARSQNARPGWWGMGDVIDGRCFPQSQGRSPRGTRPVASSMPVVAQMAMFQ